LRSGGKKLTEIVQIVWLKFGGLERKGMPNDAWGQKMEVKA
jgi:hypothetical protein